MRNFQMEYKKNEDGTDMLDENGNPIPVEPQGEPAGTDAIASAIAPLVSELKELRASNSLLKDMLEHKEDPKPEQPVQPVTEEEKIAAIVKNVLQANKSSDAQANKEAAFEKFVAANKEFHPENDSLGLKAKALKDKFNQFNTEKLSSVDEFLAVISDAKRLLVGNDTQPEPSLDVNKLPSSPAPRNQPSSKPTEELSPLEIKLAEQTGRTKEQIIALKKKHPDLIADMLEHIRG